jgi:hypothetical protein
MKRILIDPRGRSARIQPGVTSKELEEACSALGPCAFRRSERLRAGDLLAAHVFTPHGALVEADMELLSGLRTGRAAGI